MNVARLLLLAALMLGGCARLPEIHATQCLSPAECEALRASVFPQGRWQLVHSLLIHPPVGSEQTVLGVIQLSSLQGTFHCFLMTIEGLVLFEAEYNGAATVQRALPPLDRPGMAEGIVQDIALIFLEPKQPLRTAGLGKDSRRICRYPAADLGVEDIALSPDGSWEIRLYTKYHRLTRIVSAPPQDDSHASVLPSLVELIAPGPMGYRLKMRLIDAIPLEE